MVPLLLWTDHFTRLKSKKILSNQDYYKELDKSPHKNLKKPYTKYLKKYE